MDGIWKEREGKEENEKQREQFPLVALQGKSLLVADISLLIAFPDFIFSIRPLRRKSATNLHLLASTAKNLPLKCVFLVVLDVGGNMEKKE